MGSFSRFVESLVPPETGFEREHNKIHSLLGAINAAAGRNRNFLFSKPFLKAVSIHWRDMMKNRFA